MNSICPEPQKLRAFVFGQLTEESLGSVSSHVQRCPACEKTVAALRETTDTDAGKALDAPSRDEVAEQPTAETSPAEQRPAPEAPGATATFQSPLPAAGSDAREFDEYLLLGKLGEGGMGVVYKAQHRRMHRLVAIKMLSPKTMKSPEAIQRFYREVEAAAKLTHPNIVAAFDAREYQGTHYLVMEYVEGQDLAKLVKQHGPLPVEKAVDYALQTARGLQYSHGEGVVHRDIKPGNLLLDKKGTVKILDMGLARLEVAAARDDSGGERLTQSGQVMGTCEYMAPEQALDTHTADARSDIYSLGCTLYRLLIGQPPYQGDTLMKVLLAHRELPIPSLRRVRPEVPEQLDTVFQKMMAKEPKDRYQSMGEVIVELEAVLAALADRSVSEGALGVRRFIAAFCPDRVRHTEKAATSRRTPKALLLGLGGGLVLLLGVILTITLRHGTLVVEIDEKLGKDVQVTVSQGGQEVKVADEKSGWTLSLGPGKYDLSVQGGEDKFRLDSQNVTVTRGGQAKVKVTLKSMASAATMTTWPADSPVGKPGAPLPAISPFDGTQAKEHQTSWAKHLGVPVEITNSIGMKLVLIPPGEFQMGSSQELIEEELMTTPKDDKLCLDRLSAEGPRHHVRITRPFYLGMYPVTQEEYQKVTGANPSEFSATGKGKDKVAGQDTKRFPVELVSWQDADEFCWQLSEMAEEKSAAWRYRLPSEAQWEYACRVGTTGRWSFSAARDGKEAGEGLLAKYAWFGDNSGGRPHTVGGRRASPWGLYDIYGNVWQWCQDWRAMDYYANSPTDDPAGPPGGSDRVQRGGSWDHPARNCRSGDRGGNVPGIRNHDLGFRVCLVLADE